MAGKRTYAEACGMARALDAVGERWALMIVRELILGPKRFTDIRTALPGLSTDILAQRLRELDAAGIVTRRALPPPAASKVYELTPAGAALEPVLVELGRWGGTYADPPDPGMCMSFDSHILSFRTLFDSSLAGDFDAVIQLRLDGRPFRAEVAGGSFSIDPGEDPSPDVTITSDPTTLIDVAHGRRKLADAREAGDVRIEGDKRAAARFLRLFPIPQPGAVPTAPAG